MIFVWRTCTCLQKLTLFDKGSIAANDLEYAKYFDIKSLQDPVIYVIKYRT